MNLTNKKELSNSGNMTIKVVFFFGLIFAQISNFVFWIEEAIPIEEFFIVDMFLIFSLFIIIFKEYGFINSHNKLIHYICLLGALNNFIITLFFLCWGIFFPEKDMTFVQKIGINGNFQIVFDLISLIVLRLIYIKYKNTFEGINREKIIFYEVLLMIGLASTLLVM